MAEDSDLERTEEATPRRREQAREEGQVPRSRELATFTVTMTGVAMLVAYGGVLYQQLKELFARTLTFTRATLDAEDAARTRPAPAPALPLSASAPVAQASVAKPPAAAEQPVRLQFREHLQGHWQTERSADNSNTPLQQLSYSH